jgi:hypothetical protein
MKPALMLLCAILVLAGPMAAEIIPGQAVSWSNFSYITGIAVGHEYVYFGTTEGILRYQLYEQKWADPITVSDGLQGDNIQRLAVSSDDQELTVETEDGIYSYDATLQDWYLDTEFPALYYRDSRPRRPLPMMYMPQGYQLSPEGYFSDPYFRNYQLTAMLESYMGEVFLGTWGMGPARTDSRDWEVELMPYGLLQKETDAIYIDGDSLWLAGNAGERLPEYPNARLGVTLYDRASQTFTHYETRMIPGFDSEIIYDIAGDAKNIYFAGRQGVTVLSRKDQRFFTLGKRDGLPDKETTALAVGADSVWIGTANGLALYTPSVDTMVVVGRKLLGNLFITDLLLVDGRLIIGTGKGAYYVSLATRQIGRLQDPESILRGSIRHLSVIGKELLVSSSLGLTIVDLTTEKATPVPYVTAANAPFAAVANETHIAAVTNDGLVLIERATGKKRTFDERDGLLSLRINALVVEGDYLWLGSDEGLTRFRWMNPDRVD